MNRLPELLLNYIDVFRGRAFPIEQNNKNITELVVYINELNNKTEKQEKEIERLNKEVEKYKKRCLTGLRLIRNNYGVLDKYGVDMLDDILNGVDKE